MKKMKKNKKHLNKNLNNIICYNYNKKITICTFVLSCQKTSCSLNNPYINNCYQYKSDFYSSFNL